MINTEFTKKSPKDKKTVFRAILAIILSTVTIILCSVLSGAEVYTIYLGKTVKKLPVYRVKREDKKISISFDCAWGVEHTDAILEAMQKFDVKCTFFAVQFWVEKYPEYVKKIFDNGHEMGTHSATHAHMSKLDKTAVRKELISSSQAIESISGKKVQLFRAPFGEYNDQLIDIATELDLYTIQWDVDSLDWKDLSANEIAERVLKRVKSGSIILCHNNGLHTAEALPLIFSTLLGKGYEFVPISELIYKDNYVIDANGEQLPKS